MEWEEKAFDCIRAKVVRFFQVYREIGMKQGGMMKTTQVRANTSSSDAIFQPLPPDVREGDWMSFRRHMETIQHHNVSTFDPVGGVIAYKRACALTYLGKRAQLHGGVCIRTRPRILTAEFVTELSKSNCTVRFSRYPWLETLINLLTEIERIQDEVTLGENVISLVPTSRGE